jgi:hypothetical protein
MSKTAANAPPDGTLDSLPVRSTTADEHGGKTSTPRICPGDGNSHATFR